MSMDSGSSMQMTFFTSTATPLFSDRLTPSGTGSYAGLCIFLIFLALITRCLVAFRTILETKWLDMDRKRRYVVVADQPTEEQNVMDSDQASNATLITARGLEEKVKVLTAHTRPVTAWRFSVDLPRALLTTLVAGLGYLLMLAVMSFNVGYFLSVLGGIFLGDLAVGRYAGGGGDH